MVIIISGTPAAGKSSVSRALAEKFPKSAYLDIDSFKDMIVGGNVALWDPEGPEQFKLVEKNFLAVTKNFLEEEFVVIIDYVMGDEQVKGYDDLLGEVHGFLLLPTLEELKRRDKKRDPEHKMGHRIDALYPQFANAPHPVLKVIDSTNQTVKETAAEIYESLKK